MRTTSRVAALLAAAALSTLPVLPAAAHDELVAVAPEPGSVLDSAPEQIELSFSGRVMDIGHQVLVTDAEGRSVTDGPPALEGAEVVQPLTDGSGSQDQSYRVVWRVVSSDGHPIEGTFGYDVGDGADPSEPAAAPQPTDARDGSGGSRWLVAGAGAALALAVLGVVGLASRRRRRG